MDDPWGSPWADEAEIHHDGKKDNKDHEVRPTTPLRASTLALEDKTNSPWGDQTDDGFGDWATIPADEGNATGFDGTGDGWEGNAASSVKLEGILLSPELPWNSTPTTTSPRLPGLSPSLMPKSSQFLRQPSPDPWATEFVPNDVPPSKSQLVDEDGKAGSEHVNNEVMRQSIIHPLPTADTLEAESSSDKYSATRHISTTEESAALQNSTDTARTLLPLEAPEDIPDAEPISSRPSSSPSERSRHDENLQESPRTSIDEPQMSRKVSSKVQGLVEHMDGLAKAEDCEPVERSNTAPSSQDDVNVPENLEGDMDDFGDFERGNSEAGDSNEETAPAAVEKQIVIPDAALGSQDSDVTRKTPASLEQHHGLVKFNIDVSVLTKIYPDIDNKPAEERVFIPDRDLDNTLSTTEQRKTWYRISRYGTKRKHDTGGDENYVRINWAHSQMRKETLKIVARWMEEDRMSGRVVLGGASKGSSVFGWSNSKVAPVPIAHAFAARIGKKPDLVAPESLSEVPREWPKGLVKERSRSTSKTRSPSTARRHSSVKSVSVSDDVKPIPEVPIADFGWNASGTPVQDVDSEPSPAKTSPPSKPRSSSRSTSSVTASSENIQNKTVIAGTKPAVRPLSTIQTSIQMLPSLVTDIKNEDEDDWGELVASPAISTPPVLPLANNIVHKKSPSFSVTLSAGVVAPLTPGFQPQTSPLSGTHHSNSSFDKSLVAHSPVPISAYPTPPTTANGLSSASTEPTEGPSFALAAITVDSTISTMTPDPWASADFSLFDSPAPAPVPAPFQTSKSTPKISRKATASKTVSFSAPVPAITSKPTWTSKEEIEQDGIVESVVKALPDLSYMLRR